MSVNLGDINSRYDSAYVEYTKAMKNKDENTANKMKSRMEDIQDELVKAVPENRK